jgi:hypothetical protein
MLKNPGTENSYANKSFGFFIHLPFLLAAYQPLTFETHLKLPLANIKRHIDLELFFLVRVQLLQFLYFAK